VGRGHKQYRDEEPLQAAVLAILERHGVASLLQVTWQREEEKTERYRGSGRAVPAGRSIGSESSLCDHASAAQESAIQHAKDHQGWRVQVTNLPANVGTC